MVTTGQLYLATRLAVEYKNLITELQGAVEGVINRLDTDKDNVNIAREYEHILEIVAKSVLASNKHAEFVKQNEVFSTEVRLVGVGMEADMPMPTDGMVH